MTTLYSKLGKLMGFWKHPGRLTDMLTHLHATVEKGDRDGEASMRAELDGRLYVVRVYQIRKGKR